MKVIRRSEFLKLPAETAYAKGGKWVFGEISFKGETIGNDWWYRRPSWIEGEDTGECVDRLEQMLDAGTSFPIDSYQMRDGCFDEDDLFLIFEEQDLLTLRDWIDEALNAAKSR